MAGDLLLVGSGRVWTIKHRAGPGNEPYYHHMGMAGAPDWGQGDVTRIEVPSDRQYNRWEEISRFQASPDRATITLTIYETADRSEFMDIIRLRCALDVQIHLGLCEDPRDFDGGWQKIRVLEDALPTGYSAGEQGALEGSSQASITEELPLSASSIYDILRMNFTSVASQQAGEVVVAVDVADSISCGDCEDRPGSDGTQRIVALTNSSQSSPGLKPQVILTENRFSSAIERWVTTAAVSESATDAAVVGDYLVVVAPVAGKHHFASIPDMYNENETWTAVTTGYVGTNGPLSIWSYSPLFTFIGGEGGYIYKMTNPADGVTVASSGLTSADLVDITGFDMDRIAAVGAGGVMVFTRNGQNFQLAATTPPDVTDLNAVAYRTKSEIWVGGSTSGAAHYTNDFGTTWKTKMLPGNLTQIDAIVWANATVGFIAGRDATPRGKILRTINGGYTWYVMPEASGQGIPAVDYILDMVTFEKEPNMLVAGGLNDNGNSGSILLGVD